jgi:putative tryptophan/tyrosine transport system substrate-binding protein
MKKAAALSILVAVIMLAVAVIAAAQQPMKIPRRGFVTGVSCSDPGILARTEAFRQGLRELGYVEGTIIVEYRYGDGKFDHLSEAAA